MLDFYDGFADSYHVVYGDAWDAAVERQGAALDRLFGDVRGDARLDVLDCSCGIGTQATGLALRGHRVTGTDISGRSVDRARIEAQRLAAEVTFGIADFRDLSTVAGSFDVVISCDNAIPHLVDDAEIETAFRAMRSKLRPGGLLVISTRDYDRAMVERPAVAPPVVLPGPPRQIVVRLQEWEPLGPHHTVRFLVLTEDAQGWSVDDHHVTYRAVTRDTLTGLAEHARFTEVAWLTADEVGFHQPIMIATNPELQPS